MSFCSLKCHIFEDKVDFFNNVRNGFLECVPSLDNFQEVNAINRCFQQHVLEPCSQHALKLQYFAVSEM